MRKRDVWGWTCGVLVAGCLAAPAADAGECLVNGNPVSPGTLANALELGSGASLPGQLAGVPFSVVSYENVAVRWTGCAGDCIVSDYAGETQCGNLVETPVDALAEAEYFAPGQPDALAQAAAAQDASGTWSAFALGIVKPSFEQDGGSAAFNYELGTRDVIDVTSGSAAEMLPLTVQLRARGHLGIQICRGDVFQWIPSHSLRFRVVENSSVSPFTRTLVNEIHSQFMQQELVFPLDVRPNSELVVDVWFKASANATGAQDVFGHQCRGGAATLDYSLHPKDGIQLFLSPDPALALAPRSGLTYELPEPAGAAATALLTLAALGARRTRARP